jgi:glycosyltransferase involved in cell wall biosynthesis
MDDWELLVYDSYSDDGAWELIRDLGLKENRMRIFQGPREGPYPAWNECLRRAKAEFVYIATSDDTMAFDCLEKMLNALERHPDCDLAHCPLVFLDKAGAPVAEQSWPECTVFGHGIGPMVNRPHVRRAPYDGLLQLTGQHVYLSITQLLIRRSLFSQIGYFPFKWGTISDFNWEMKAGLVANSVHVPDTWASWRLHDSQASASIDVYSPDRDCKIDEMIRDAIDTCEPYLAPAVLSGLRSRWLDMSSDMRSYYANLRHRRSTRGRRLFQLGQVFGGSAAAHSQLIGALFGRKKWGETAPTAIRLWLESIAGGPVIEPAF